MTPASTALHVRVLWTDLKCVDNDDEIGIAEDDEIYINYAVQVNKKKTKSSRWPGKGRVKEDVGEGDRPIKKPLVLFDGNIAPGDTVRVVAILWEQDKKYEFKISGKLDDPDFSLAIATFRNLFAGGDDPLGEFGVTLSSADGSVTKNLKAGKRTSIMKLLDKSTTVRLQMSHKAELKNVVTYRASIQVEVGDAATKWKQQSKTVAV